MEIIRSVPRMRECSARFHREGLRVGFVPTMGFLHAGHLSLVRAAQAMCDRVVLSIFVNPTQFGPNEDLAAYPRDFERDAELCRASGVDVVFCPSAGDMYPADYSVYVEEVSLSAGLCGALREGHFRGVTTIVAKLFNIVCPDVAVFGQKDAQQARVIEKMVGDLNFPVRIAVAPTQREPDGLAMSSRNVYLNPDERRRATSLYRALQAAEQQVADGVRDAATVLAAMRSTIAASNPDRIDYIKIVDYETLRPTDQIRGKSLAAIAVRFGRARLIDNTILQPG